MKKITFIQLILTTRKQGGRPSVVITPKKAKAKADRNSWKRERE